MNVIKMAGIAMVVAGVLGVVYGSLSYARETQVGTVSSASPSCIP